MNLMIQDTYDKNNMYIQSERSHHAYNQSLYTFYGLCIIFTTRRIRMMDNIVCQISWRRTQLLYISIKPQMNREPAPN